MIAATRQPGRRTLLSGLAALALAPRPAGAALPVPATLALAFDVSRKASRIGTHAVTFSTAGDDLTVRIAVDLAIGLGPVTLYRYTLRGTEEWRGTTLLRAAVQTNDGGDKDFMNATRQDGRLQVDGSKSGRYAAPAGTICASHWNQAEMDGPMINPQNGELLDFTVTPRGADRIMAGGKPLDALHFALTGPAELNLWYEETRRWAGLRAVAKDGSVVTYQRT